MPSTSPATKDLIVRLADDPLDVACWRRLMLLCLDQNEPDTFKTFQVIVQGLEMLAEARNRSRGRKEKEVAPLRLRNLVALAESPSSPRLLQQVGQMYLEDFDLPRVAHKHFVRALFYSPNNPDITADLTQSVARIDEQADESRVRAEKEGESSQSAPPPQLGVAVAQRRKPKAAAMIRQTGHMKRDPSEQTGRLPSQDGSSHATDSIRTHDGKARTVEDGASTVPLASSPEQAEALIDRSIEALQRGEFPLAESLCRQAGAAGGVTPRAWETWTALGFAQYERGLFADAVRAYHEAAVMDPNRMDSWFNLGIAFQQHDQLEEALDAYLRAREIEPEHPRILSNLGALYFRMSRLTEAEEVLRQAVAIKPDYARAWDNLAAALGALDKLDEAIEACRQAIAHKEDYAEPWYKMGFILFQNESYAEAEDALTRVLKLRPDFSYAAAYLAMIAARQGRVEEANTFADQAESLRCPRDLLGTVYNEIGVAQRDADNRDDAIASFQSAIRANPELWEAWFNLGGIYEDASKREDAVSCYSTCSQLNPEFAEARTRMNQLRRKGP